ncbi:hypothetical protein CDD80_4752 [Ophiocordyceps camponoti-rufipedis]|uniref:Uncharacterized protein n=1 Tax=Ophiocordyceps camponoti-rufipedis TaxID=2004952 RepID=A0A2C5YWK4_9HYPO|nr:hypothetical protein CDD80_4752 [Ophiocordyceps camponoti-rufipedis]
METISYFIHRSSIASFIRIAADSGMARNGDDQNQREANTIIFPSRAPRRSAGRLCCEQQQLKQRSGTTSNRSESPSPFSAFHNFTAAAQPEEHESVHACLTVARPKAPAEDLSRL